MQDDYSKGASDCAEGVAHEVCKSEQYDSGYSDQYQFEQIATKTCEVNHG